MYLHNKIQLFIRIINNNYKYIAFQADLSDTDENVIIKIKNRLKIQDNRRLYLTHGLSILRETAS